MKLYLLLSILLCLSVNYVIAAPSSGGNISLSQSGNIVNVQQFGDEFFHWFQTDDNYLLGFNNSGNIEYMGNISGNLEFTGVELEEFADLSGLSQNDFPDSDFFRNIKATRNDKLLSTNTLSESGNINNLVILVYFNDHKDLADTTLPDSDFAITPSDTSSYESLFNSSTNSLNHYFDEMSQSALNVNSYLTPWLSISGNEQDYGYDTSDNTDAGIESFYDDVITALNSGNAQDLPALDGSIDYDMITIIHSGKNQASINSSTNSFRLWSRWDEISNPSLITVGGSNIQISRSVTISALGGDGSEVTDLGVLCHEVSHFLGLPDLYEYHEASYGIGTWGLMGLGAWGYSGNAEDSENPMPLSAYSLEKLNWSSNTIVDISSANVEISNIESNHQLLRFRGSSNLEYFLMEYRSLDSNYYGYQMNQASSKGALIWHIYTPAISSSSSDIIHPIVRLVEADDDNSLTSGNQLVDSGDIWSGNSFLSTFSSNNGASYSNSNIYDTSYSKPSSNVFSYNYLYNFRVGSNKVTFDYTGQRTSISIQDFSNGIIQWEAIEGAVSYRVEREDNGVGGFVLKSSGNSDLFFDDPDISGEVDFKYRVIAQRYFDASEVEFYSDEFFYGFVVSSVSFNPDNSSLEITFNQNVNLASSNIFDLTQMRILDATGNSMFSLEGSSTGSYSFPGVENSNINASFDLTSDLTTTVSVSLGASQVYEIINNSDEDNDNLYFEIDANSAELNSTPAIANSAQLFSDNLAIAVDGFKDTTAPSLISIEYNDSVGQFTLNYSEPIWFDSLNFSNFTFTAGSNTTTLEGSSYSISSNILVITLDLEKKARVTSMNFYSANVTTLSISAGEVQNFTLLDDIHQDSNFEVTEDSTEPYLTSFSLHNRDEDRYLELRFNESIFFFNDILPTNSSDFEAVVLSSNGQEIIEVSGNGYSLTTVTDTSIAPSITRVDAVTIELLPSEIEVIDEGYGFVNPAPTVYLKIGGVVFSDYRQYLLGNNNAVDTSVTSVSSTDYIPKRRARFIHPHYDDTTTETDEDEGLIWKSTHEIRWEINGGWDQDDTLKLEWVNGNVSTDTIETSFKLSSGSNTLATIQGKEWDTTLVSDNLDYQFRLLRDSDSKEYQASENFVEVDNTIPTVYMSYLSESTPTNKVNAVVEVNSNRHTFDLDADEQKANVLILANYSELMISSPTLHIDQQGTSDITVEMSPADGTLPSNVFYYAYDIQVQDAGNYLDGEAQVSITDVRDRARGHLVVNSDSEAEEILGHLNSEVDTDTVFFSIDTIAPTISSLEFLITDISIVAETSTLELQFSEDLYLVNGDEEITGVLNPENYEISGLGASGLEVMDVTVSIGSSNTIYTLSLNGIVELGNLELKIFQESIVDFHNNPFGSPNSAEIDWPGPLIHLHEVVVSPGGRTRLLLRGGFTPYLYDINSLYLDYISLSTDNKTINGLKVNSDPIFVEVTENKNQLRIIPADVLSPRTSSIDLELNAYRDDFDFKMVSFPFNLENWNGASLIALLDQTYGTFGSDYVLYYYNENGQYVSVDENTEKVGPGFGFWMGTRKQTDKTLEAEGPLLEQVVAVDLHQGWNLIGNPFDVDLSVDQIYVSTEATRSTVSDVKQSETGHKVWHIESGSLDYEALDTIPPATGAWLYVENQEGAEVMYFRTPEDDTLDIIFEKSNPNTRQATEAFPPSRPSAFSVSTSSSGGSGGGGGGCLLKLNHKGFR